MSTALPPLRAPCSVSSTPTAEPLFPSLWRSLALPHPVGVVALQPRNVHEETHRAFLHRVLCAALEAGEAVGRTNNNLEDWESSCCWSDDEEEDDDEDEGVEALEDGEGGRNAAPSSLRGSVPAASSSSTTQPNDSDPAAKAPPQ